MIGVKSTWSFGERWRWDEDVMLFITSSTSSSCLWKDNILIATFLWKGMQPFLMLFGRVFWWSLYHYTKFNHRASVELWIHLKRIPMSTMIQCTEKINDTKGSKFNAENTGFSEIQYHAICAGTDIFCYDRQNSVPEFLSCTSRTYIKYVHSLYTLNSQGWDLTLFST